MYTKKLVTTGLAAAALICFCAKLPADLERNNPLDPNGNNRRHPVVTAMNDTSVAVYDTFFVHATGTDSNGTIKKFLWALDGVSYGDTTDSGRVKAAFITAGVKTVRVKVRDDAGIVSAVDSVKVTVHLYPPAVLAMNDTNVAINDSFNVHAAGTDTNGTIMRYLWALNGVNYNDSTNSGLVKTAFTSSGIKTVLVKVRDDDGIVSAKADTVLITVHSYAPGVVAMLDTNVAINDSFFIHATGTDTNGTIVKYLWALNGANYNDSTNNGQFKTAFTSAGVKTVLVKVRDDDGIVSVNADTVRITVHTYAPVVVAMNDTTVAINDSFFIHATGTDTNGTIVKYLWALNGANYNDSTNNGQFKTAFTSAGVKTVLVKVRDDDGIVSVNADTVKITVSGLTPPAAPTLTSPSNGLTGVPLTPTIVWSDTSVVTSYHLQVAIDSAFTSLIVNNSTLTITSMTIVSSLANSTKYYWRVNATNANGTSAWSSVWAFTTEAVAGGMVLIPAKDSSFSMGSTTGYSSEQPVHTVSFTYDFYMDRTEVRQGDYQTLMGVNPSNFTGDTNRPVETLTWFDAVLYCNARSKRDMLDTVYTFTSITGTPGNGCSALVGLAADFSKNGYRLPTEAEWEYACRAGTTTDFYWGSYPPTTIADTAAMNNNAVWGHNSNDSTARVGTKLPNAFGLYDMSGNVWEWCNDWYDDVYYSSSPSSDPTGPSSSPSGRRVLRGGGYTSLAGDSYLRSADRNNHYPYFRIDYYGFRCVRGPIFLPPAAPTLTLPSNGLTGVSLTPTLAWSDTSVVTSYHLQVSTVSNFGSTVVDNSTLTSTSMTIASSLAYGKTYFWRVNATNAGGTGAWSPVWSFTTEAVASGMVLIPAAGKNFSMGQTGIAEPVHTVSFTYDFSMDVTEVTQADYLALMLVNPSYFTGNSLRPVETVTWFDAVLYCNARSKRDMLDTVYRFTSITGTPGNGCSDLGGLAIDLTKNGYRLPTEAEWEYACRAGTTTDYYWGRNYPPTTLDDTLAIDSNAVWLHNSNDSTQTVASKKPNAWGLYDMCGNVWEWCNDWHDSYTSGSQTDPTGPSTGSYRVLRGGAWNYVDYPLRSANRNYVTPAYWYYGDGFRCARGPIPPPPPAWSALGSGMNSTVYGLAVDSSGNLYAGGQFTTAGGAAANYIAKWNGSSWSALGSGMSGGIDSWVEVVAVDDTGNLYAGGLFTAAGGAAANHIAKWNGSSWSALGSGINNYVFALAVDDLSGNLFAGGQFTTAGGTVANYIARWTGSAWSALGSGMNGKVYALAVDLSGNLFAGGEFTTAGGASANYIAKWNGSAWSALGSGMNNTIYALAVDSSGNLYAGGNFTTAGGLAANYIAKWNGSAWSALSSGMNSTVGMNLAVDLSGNLYAGGNFTTAGGLAANYIAKWNGTAWSALGSGMDNGLQALAIDGSGNLFAAGYFTTAGGTAANHIAKWK